MDLTLRPKLYDFRNLVEYTIWLTEHSNEIPEAGEVLIFKLHAEDFLWLLCGNGKSKMIDLPRLV